MKEYTEVFVGMDVAKDRHAVAVAEGGRNGEVRYLGEVGTDDASIRRLVRKLERPGVRLRFCYGAGPTGYGLKRAIEALGHDCALIAPSLIPNRPGDRVGRLEKAIEDSLRDWHLAPIVERLQALRGVRLICAVTFMVEIGDVRRFANPRQLMACPGLVLSCNGRRLEAGHKAPTGVPHSGPRPRRQVR